MKTLLVHLLLFTSVCAIAATQVTSPSSKSSKRSETLTVHREAFAQPFDHDKLTAYMNSLPKDGDYFVVEGDLLLTEQELRSYLVTNAQGEKPAAVSPELLVNTHNGDRDYYRDLAKRNLSYAVDRKTFTAQEYTLVLKNMGQAGKAWESACADCQIHFTHVPQADDDPQPEKVNFIVRKHDSKGEYIAASFFPHDDASRRNLNIDPAYFTTRADKVGVLRHEMGHILGYRHEHIRGISGCYFEDNFWQPLTPYDPKSVMHYFCGGGGSLQLELTALDRSGHRALYGGPSGSTSSDQTRRSRTVVVNFEGGYVSQNIIKVLEILQKDGLIEEQVHQPGTATWGIDSFFLTRPESPFDTKVAVDLADHYNPRTQSGAGDPFRPPETVMAPSLKLEPYDYSMVFDLSSDKDAASLKEIKDTWPNSVNYEKLNGDIDTLTLRGYQLRVPVSSEDKAREVQRAVLATVSPRTTSVTIVGPPNPGEYYTHAYVVRPWPESPPTSNGETGSAPPEDTKENVKVFWSDVKQLNQSHQPIKLGIQGVLGYLVGLSSQNEKLTSCSGVACPDIYLIDTPVDRHPDLIPSLVDGGTDHSLASPAVIDPNDHNKDKQNIEEGKFNEQQDHGTHLAGIIASQDNQFGLIGIHPGAHLHSWDWSTYSGNHAAIAAKMRGLKDKPSLQIYLFANSWDWDMTLATPEQRFLADAIGKRIVNSRPLWIIAAGEQDSGGMRITPYDKKGPMNMGNVENVIVVTAYEDSSTPFPHLRRDSNYSLDGLVHIAGPGGEVPSTISNGKYVAAGGTSEAAAFVAGVASAMVSLYPTYYPTAEKVKFRLQITASPDMASEDLPKVSAGMLDAKMALLDPAKNWLDNDRAHADKVSWCTDKITILDPVDKYPLQGGEAVDVKDVFRLHETNGKWFIFQEVEEKHGEIKRLGPGIIDDNKNILSADGRNYKLSQLRDILLSGDAHEVVECRCTVLDF